MSDLKQITLNGKPYSVTPGSHAEDKNDPHEVTPAQIGAVPFGMIYNSDADYDALPNGIHWVNTATGNWTGKNIPPITIGWIHVFTAPDGFSTVQKLYGINSKSPDLSRRWVYGNTPTEWEWENPPMESGVVYRTTERINNKAVYKRINSDTGRLEYSVDDGVWAVYTDLIGALDKTGGTMNGSISFQWLYNIDDLYTLNRLGLRKLEWRDPPEHIDIPVPQRFTALVSISFNGGGYALYQITSNSGRYIDNITKLNGNVDLMSFAINTDYILTITSNQNWSHGFIIWTY